MSIKKIVYKLLYDKGSQLYKTTRSLSLWTVAICFLVYLTYFSPFITDTTAAHVVLALLLFDAVICTLFLLYMARKLHVVINALSIKFEAYLLLDHSDNTIYQENQATMVSSYIEYSKIGDRVTHHIHGIGTITDIAHVVVSVVTVQFDEKVKGETNDFRSEDILELKHNI